METIRVRNPRSGQFDYEFPVPEPEALARRVGELRAAQQAWAANQSKTIAVNAKITTRVRVALGVPSTNVR